MAALVYPAYRVARRFVRHAAVYIVDVLSLAFVLQLLIASLSHSGGVSLAARRRYPVDDLTIATSAQGSFSFS